MKKLFSQIRIFHQPPTFGDVGGGLFVQVGICVACARRSARPLSLEFMLFNVRVATALKIYDY